MSSTTFHLMGITAGLCVCVWVGVGGWVGACVCMCSYAFGAVLGH